MRHFNYFPNGGPFPGICALCGIDRDLWQMGFEHFRGGDAMACSRCIGELAENIGWLPKAPLEEAISHRDKRIAELEEQLALVPTFTEELINGVRSSLTDFVFAISNGGHANRNEPIQNADGSIEPDVEGDEPADVSPKALGKPSGIEGSDDISADSVRNRPGRPRKIN